MFYRTLFKIFYHSKLTSNLPIGHYLLESTIDDTELTQFYQRIGMNVKKIREAKGLTQLELAQLIGHKSVGHVAKAELNKYDKHFNLEQLYKISKLLDVELSELIEIK